MATKAKVCEHLGYHIVDGELVCIVKECGEPSTNEKWRANVFGVDAAKIMADATAGQEG